MKSQFNDIIINALKEDVQSGDITTLASIPSETEAKAEMLVKADGVLSGIDIAKEVFLTVDNSLDFASFSHDGAKVFKGFICAIVEGNAQSILTAERTALNFIQRMSGIATAANYYQSLVSHTKCKIIDTRKTVPGLRLLDKKAVKDGGCDNHRIGLYDMFLIKDNHIVASGSITNAVNRCKEYNKTNNTNFKIEVETENLDMVKEALANNVDVIMLDNFDLYLMKEAVKLIDGKCKIEVSGGVTAESVKAIAETGVDYISSGALTHSVKALDISLNISLIL